MGFLDLPKPLGVFHVAFADFELRTFASDSDVKVGADATRRGAVSEVHDDDDVERKACDEEDEETGGGRVEISCRTPMVRFFYPTETKPKWSFSHAHTRRWLPELRYTYGFFSRSILPTSWLRRCFLWVLACLLHCWVWLQINASVGEPLIQQEGDKERLPVVIFSHGMWACRTTYTLACCDMASHGYIVVVPEHLDGSAVAAQYTDTTGKKRWIQHAFADKPFDHTPMEHRTNQLRQRVQEIQKVVDVIEMLDRGTLTQTSNAVVGQGSLNVTMLQGRLDMSYLAIRGHSFGGSTAIVVCGLDKRLKCCVAEDTWWQPIEQVHYDRLAGKAPILFLNNEKFEWEELRHLRNVFLKARAEAESDGQPLVTQLITVKGTRHMDQSDFPVLYPRIFRAAKLSGKVNTRIVKDVNSRACLEFLHRNLLPPGTHFPHAVHVVKEDSEYLIVGVSQEVEKLQREV
ncbi:hypothetical protein CY35_01G087500 [Sphagnum magellanicum]|nr:hypothetical protein CY35_01G087500 [Sphagnum magellanicum]